MTKRPIVLLVILLALLGACSSSSDTAGSSDATSTTALPAAVEPHWPLPADPMALVVAAGLTPETHETLVHHVHAHLDVFIDGVHQNIPGGIGIRIDDPMVHHDVNALGQASYGGISPPCETPCISPLHTHDPDGVLHTESAVDVDNTLGQFFTEWGVRLDGQCVGEYCAPDKAIAVYVGGEKQAADADTRAIALTDRKQITIVIGTPPAAIPNRFPGASG